MRGEATIDAGYLAYRYADATLDAREEGDEGIASVKIKRRKKSVPE
jgi:hypothetical protein